MSHFYILPPREIVEHHLSQFTQRWLPGVPCPPDVWQKLVIALVGIPCETSEAFVIHREDLPQVGDTIQDLVECYGAEGGDWVHEVSPREVSSYAVPNQVVRL
jgi:hypothetical protein